MASGNSTFAAAPNNFDEDQWLARVDQQIGSRNRLTGRFFRSFGETPAFLDESNYLSNNVGRTWLNTSTSLTDTHIFSAHVTNRFLRDEYQASDTLRWTKSSHQLSIGGEYGRAADDVTNNFRGNGRFTFNGASSPFTGDSFADFLVGKFNDFTQGAGEYRNTR